jgi:GLPGLI family protein
MKKILLPLVLLLFSAALWGQEQSPALITSGKITFEERRKVEIKRRPDGPDFPDMPPRERKSRKVLLFTDKATLYQDDQSTDEDEMDMPPDRGRMFKMMNDEEESIIFNDLTKEKILEQREFMNRFFRIEQDMPETKWKITGNQKPIIGYMCSEASSTDTAGVITVVWFAPSFAVKGGPALFCNLPGMVLEVSINNGTLIYQAISIESISQKKIKVLQPKEGRKVTDEEYKTIVAEKTKEMDSEERFPGQPQGGDSRLMNNR